MTHKNIAILRDDTTKSNTIVDFLPSPIEKRMSLWIDLLPNLPSDDGECKPTTPTEKHEEPIVKLEQGHVMGKRRMTRGKYNLFQNWN